MNHKPVTEIPARRLYRVREVAEILGLGQSMVYKMASEGQIPSVRVGRALRIPAAALDQIADPKPSAVAGVFEMVNQKAS